MKTIYLLIIMILLTSCATATEVPTQVFTPAPSFTSTASPIPTSTKFPTSTPVVPSPTITPMMVATVQTHPLTLTEFNAGTKMKRLNVIGTGTPHDIKFSPDGKRLAVATGRGIYLYDSETFEQNGFIDMNDSVSAIAFSPNSDVLAVAVDSKVSLWNVQSGQNLSNLVGGMVSIYKLAYGRGNFVAAIGADCRGCGSTVQAMILWDASTGKQIFSQHEIWYWTRALAFSSNGKQLVFGGQGGINVIESASGKQVAVYGNSPFDLVFNGDETKLFITSFSEDSKVFDITTQSQQPFLICDAYMTNASNTGACPSNKQISIFDLSTGQPIQTIEIGAEPTSLDGLFALRPDGRFLAYINKSVLSVVDVQSHIIIKTINFVDFDNALAGIVETDGIEKYVVAFVTSSGKVAVVDLQSGLEIIDLQEDCCEITSFAFAPDHKTIGTIDAKDLRLWNLQSHQIIYEAKFTDSFKGPIVFSPDGSKVFLTSLDVGILEFDLQTRQSKKLGMNAYDYVYADPFAPDNYHFNGQGDLITLVIENNNPSFVNTDTQDKFVIQLEEKPDFMFLETFAISPDNKRLVLGSSNGISVWDIYTQKRLLQLVGHETRGGDGWVGMVKRLMFNPKSNLLVSVGWDQTTRLWNIETGNELRHLNVCCSASFTPDGRYLVTAGDGVIRVWGIQQ
jgi:WD40 repeat protein